ncbi:3-hydroxybutyryl-CoA dehydrogenase [Nocardioides endophyticus]|uniref:3-hydroxybutyryl-CoA dehydrogenase n=1 Tax=Nocardioides endophyticus TaxID=1353775 RepID=A0ABP8YLU8_9ACTN
MTGVVRRVLVVGAGQMGGGIAQVAARAGFDVTLVDTTDDALDRGLASIRGSLDRFVRSGHINSEDAARALDRIDTSVDVSSSASGADLVIEAIVEDLGAKQGLFALLDAACSPEVVLATNTSQFQIGRIAESCQHRDRVIGVHFSNPPPLMPLVEVILGALTSPRTLDVVNDFLVTCGRETVLCRKDVPGFISNRLSTALFMEAARLADEEIASPADIDKVARLMYGHKMGPLATLDLAGLDTALKVSTALSEHYGGDRFTPPPILARLVAEGRFGRKTGSGFYEIA